MNYYYKTDTYKYDLMLQAFIRLLSFFFIETTPGGRPLRFCALKDPDEVFSSLLRTFSNEVQRRPISTGVRDMK